MFPLYLKRILQTACLLCLGAAACSIAEPRPRLEDLTLHDGDGERVSYRVEIASSAAARRRGLMFRESMPADQGMLLDYRRPRSTAIWMKNTLIPLDILFISPDGIVVKIHEGALPHSTKNIPSGQAVRAVLEVNAGQVQKYGIQVGDRIRHASFKGL